MEVWPYSPQAAVTESLEWLTDIQRCRSAEYRQSLRTKPRQELQYRYLMTPAQFSQAKLLSRRLGTESSQTVADALAYGSTPFSLWVPVWTWSFRTDSVSQNETHIRKDVADPYALTKNGSYFMLWESPTKYEVCAVSVNSMDAQDPYITLTTGVSQAYTTPVVVPLRVGELAQEFEATRATYQQVETAVRFRVLAGDDYSAEVGALYSSETYSGHPVAIDRSLVGSGVREQFERNYDELDSVIGKAHRYPTFSAPGQTGQITWSAQTRAGMRALLYWLHSRKGRWKSFWVPSWNSDIAVTHEIASSDTSIEVTDIGLRSRGIFPLDIMILAKDGTRIYCHVTGATAGSTGKELLGLSAQVGAHLYTWDIASVCILTLSRLAADRIEIEHGSGETLTVSAPVVEVPA